MKYLASILFIYIMALTAMPSVRAVKLTLHKKHKTESSQNTSENGAPNSCQKGKIIMGLNFLPMQFLEEVLTYSVAICNYFEVLKKEKLNYKKHFIDQYCNAIWQPPKIAVS